jgi:uncharacterized membrane protein
MTTSKAGDSEVAGSNPRHDTFFFFMFVHELNFFFFQKRYYFFEIGHLQLQKFCKRQNLELIQILLKSTMNMIPKQ